MHINCLDLQFKPSYILCIFALRTSVKTKNSEYLWKYFLAVNSYINLRYSFHLSRFFLLHEPMVAMLNYNRITFSGNPRQIIPGGVLNTGQNSSEQKPCASYILYKGIIEVQSVRADFSFSCIYVSPPKVNHSLSQRSAQIIFLSNVVFNTHKTYLDISTWNINGRIIFITKLPLIP